MIILASQSPRRKQLMQEEISSCFTIIVPEIDESLSFKNHTNVEDIVKDISKRKCLKIAEDHPNDLVIAADTVVVINNQIIGKPKDEEDAYRILRLLSNNTHYVNKVAITEVTFNDLSDELIYDYIKSGSPMDKAGAYGYQDNKDFALVKKISGSRNNVIGFPTEAIKEDLKKYFSL